MDLNVVVKFALNFLFISMPEELFLITLPFILLGRIELLNATKTNIKNIVLAMVSFGLVTNFLKYNNADVNIIPLFSLATLTLSTTLIYKVNFKGKSKIDIAKSIGVRFGVSFISLLILIMTEALYVPTVMSWIGKTYTDIGDNVVLSFILSAPERIFEYCVAFFLYIKMFDKKFNKMKIIVVKEIFKNKTHAFVTFSSLAFIFIYCLSSYKIIMSKILLQLDLMTQILILAIFVSVPVVILFLNWYYTYSSKKSDLIKKQNFKSFVDAATFDDENNINLFDLKELERIM